MLTGMKLSRAALLLSSLVFIGVLVWVAVTAGDEIPAHYDGSGQVDRMDSKLSFLFTMGGTGFLLIGLFASVRWWFPKLPAQYVNLPTRRMHDYWTAAENRPALNRKVPEDLDWIGVSTNLLLAWFGGVAGTTADDGANVWVLAVPTGLYMLAVLGYTVFIVRGGRYRVPND
ncbi:hypothetical protein HQO84_14815 [Rhodococcus fascians]|nr:hypothetical protein [Rhodococcus fascians]MBY3996233.1 hypothetical protein [Rhodococcus fascians]MBY4003052.1 hypothetical protein [Rhodococcus fascians]MBY4007802.1 hypothetical protein [Rhodococcus fascians]MBY4017445.1 hypothetical protein [Rhodococcus fascians]